METAIAIGSALLPKLVQYIAEAMAAGAKDEREATHRALQRLADEHKLEATLPKVEQLVEDARRPASERDAD